MRLLGFGWGIGGVLLLLFFAIYRLLPMALELSNFALGWLHWAALVTNIVFMTYYEGYKGFHKGFSPRVVVRANYLRNNPQIGLVILAPLFCMGYIFAIRRRMIISISVSLMIVCLVILVRMLPQPWRGIVDSGVVLGLFLGICSIFYYLVQSILRPDLLNYSTDVPGNP